MRGNMRHPRRTPARTHTMNTTASTRPQQQARHDRSDAQQRERFDVDFDDAALERALRTVSWNPKDVANFLRTHSGVR